MPTIFTTDNAAYLQQLITLLEAREHNVARVYSDAARAGTPGVPTIGIIF